MCPNEVQCFLFRPWQSRVAWDFANDAPTMRLGDWTFRWGEWILDRVAFAALKMNVMWPKYAQKHARESLGQARCVCFAVFTRGRVILAWYDDPYFSTSLALIWKLACSKLLPCSTVRMLWMRHVFLLCRLATLDVYQRGVQRSLRRPSFKNWFVGVIQSCSVHLMLFVVQKWIKTVDLLLEVSLRG